MPLTAAKTAKIKTALTKIYKFQLGKIPSIAEFSKRNTLAKELLYHLLELEIDDDASKVNFKEICTHMDTLTKGPIQDPVAAITINHALQLINFHKQNISTKYLELPFLKTLIDPAKTLDVADTSSGNTPLDYLLRGERSEGHDQIAWFFITSGVSVNHKNTEGYTALMQAAKNDHENILRYLVINGHADLHLTNKDNTALTYAKERNNKANTSFLTDCTLVHNLEAVNTVLSSLDLPLLVPEQFHSQRQVVDTALKLIYSSCHSKITLEKITSSGNTIIDTLCSKPFAATYRQIYWPSRLNQLNVNYKKTDHKTESSSSSSSKAEEKAPRKIIFLSPLQETNTPKKSKPISENPTVQLLLSPKSNNPTPDTSAFPAPSLSSE